MMRDRRISILVIVNAIFGYDGISNVATNYYKYQDKTQVRMDMVTINPIPEVLRLEIEKDGNHSFVIAGRNRNPVKYILSLANIIRKNRYDIVYVHGNSATMAVELFAAVLGGCKVRVAHSHNTQCDHQKINRLLMPVFSRLYTDCCACSVEAGQFLFGKKKCHVVNNGLYLPKYMFDQEVRDSIREKYNLDDKTVIGHIGRFAYQKNQGFLVDILKAAVEKGYNAALLLVGDGELVDEVKQRVREENLEARTVFYGTTDCVNEVVQAMDCFVFPSRFEGLGIAALEAQASGLACVASNQVPRKMKVDERTTFLSLDEEIDTWVSTVIDSVISPDTRRQTVNEVKHQFEKAGYDIEKNCDEMLSFYNRILARKGIKK